MERVGNHELQVVPRVRFVQRSHRIWSIGCPRSFFSAASGPPLLPQGDEENALCTFSKSRACCKQRKNHGHRKPGVSTMRMLSPVGW